MDDLPIKHSDLMQDYLPTELVEGAEKVFRAFCFSDGRALDKSSDGDSCDINELRMNPSQLRFCLEAMGLVFMEIQVKDMLYSMLQTADTVTYNQALCSADAGAAEEQQQQELDNPIRTARSTTMMTARSKKSVAEGMSSAASHTQNGGGSSNEPSILITFSQFVDLLTMTMEDCDQDDELKLTLKAIDADHDGVISVSDLKRTLMSTSLPVEKGKQRPPSSGSKGTQQQQQQQLAYRDEEIRIMLEQVDWDNDGKVSLEDLRQTLNAN